MWDFHSHILPYMDDGAKDREEFIGMSKIAVYEGIDKMVVTPHYIPFQNEVQKDKLYNTINQYNELLRREDIPLELLPGMEVFADWEILNRMDDNQIVTLNDSRYVLLELPMIDIPDYIDDLLFEIMLRGLVPVIAHPERNLPIQNNPNILLNWIKNGALAQLNTGSLTGQFGRKTKYTASILLSHNMIHILGSDAHSSTHRSPRMKDAIEYIKEHREFHSHLILQDYPRKILTNQSIISEPPKKYRKRRFHLF